MNTLHSLHRGSAHKGEAPRLPQRLTHSNTTPTQEGLTMEFPPWLNPKLATPFAKPSPSVVPYEPFIRKLLKLIN